MVETLKTLRRLRDVEAYMSQYIFRNDILEGVGGNKVRGESVDTFKSAP